MSCLNHHFSQNQRLANITWWCVFLLFWNGVEFIQPPTTSHTLRLFADASQLGFGAVYHSHWFSVPWQISRFYFLLTICVLLL